jgi:hypothetical protein
VPTFHPSPYTPRPTSRRDDIRRAGWTLKRYDICATTLPIDESVYAEGLALALAALPQPPKTSTRPGLGFLICHQGRDVHYIVLIWWDNENELFQRVFVRTFEPDASWRDAAGGASFCVWDTEIIAAERDAYVRHVLAESPDLDAYLTATASPTPTGTSPDRASTPAPNPSRS